MRFGSFPAGRLSAEIATLLCLKLGALMLLYLAFFSPSHRIAVDAATASARILSTDTHP